MKISAKEEYGLLAMAELAGRYSDGPISLNEVSQSQELSLDYLEQIVPSLRDAKLLKSTRGVKGGYEIASSPAEITIADVLRALTGDIISSVQCVSEKSLQPCIREKVCPVCPVWKAIYNRVLETLDSITLADLIVDGS